ncbi:hypothetical protein WOC04_23480 [Vibrio parahaemolyticus]|uniref:hypothetical protein n=1 Tax=Vibrio parahaemolyticus TaxID=670 RepID=UPI001EF970A1|nr:hypothetical protein [Vibrio parahaemolyticus]MCG7792626.1 hypothetical protein [Vibrio parahaemolyticus]
MNTHILLKLEEQCGVRKVLSYESQRAVFEDEYKHIKELESNVSFFRIFCFAWKSIETNLKTLEAEVIKFSGSMSGTTVVTRVSYQHIDDISQIYTCICNFLSSANLLISLMEKNSLSEDKKDKWINKKRQLHLQNYCYRICYELRNHSQHAGVPISSINVSNLNDAQETQVSLLLEKDEILNSSQCTKNLRKYVNEAEGDIDVYANMVEFVEVLRQLLRFFFELNDEFYQPIVGYYEVYSEYVKSHTNECLILVPRGTHEKDILDVYERLDLSTCKWVLDTFTYNPT